MLTTQYIQCIYVIVLILNNQYIYLSARTLYMGPDWETFNDFFMHHYHMDFTVAALVLTPVFVTYMYIFQIIYILTSCVRKVGFWKTILFLRDCPSAFFMSILTNLAIYDMHLDKKDTNIEDPIAVRFEIQDIQTLTGRKKPESRRMSLPTRKPNVEIQRTASLPVILPAFHDSRCRIVQSNSENQVNVDYTSTQSIPVSDNPPPLNIKKSIKLFILYNLTMLTTNAYSLALLTTTHYSRDDIFVMQYVVRFILFTSYTLCYVYIIR